MGVSNNKNIEKAGKVMALVNTEMELFPPHLDQGSIGIAVLILQCLLLAAGYADQEMLPDAHYGDCTAHAVRKLQEELGVPPDGNFGMATRQAWAKKGIDVRKVPLTEGSVQRTLYKAPHQASRPWPSY